MFTRLTTFNRIIKLREDNLRLLKICTFITHCEQLHQKLLDFARRINIRSHVVSLSFSGDVLSSREYRNSWKITYQPCLAIPWCLKFKTSNLEQ